MSGFIAFHFRMKSSKVNAKAKFKKPKLTEEEKREKIRDALLKKKSYEDKAIKLVEQMIEPGLSPEWLVDSASFLNKSYYSDGVEERSLTGICGYPLCDKVREVKKKQGQFHISLKDKKVYDLEERKLFCSNWCFKASNFFREQLETSPLWLREVEKPKEVTLYQGVGAACLGGGKSVDITIVESVKVSHIEDPVIDSDSNVSDDEEANTHDSIEAEKDLSKLESLVFNEEDKLKFKKANSDKNINKTDGESVIDRVMDRPPQVSGNLELEQVGRRVKKATVKLEQREPPLVVVVSVLNSWFTIDSFRLLMGDAELKCRLQEKQLDANVWATTLGDKDMEEQYQARYRDICRRLDMVDRLEEKEDEHEKLPLPSFEMIKEHCEMENLKLSSFMAGKEVYEQEVSAKDGVVVKDVEQVEPRLPLLDHKAQQAHRRRIVLDKMFKTMPELLKLFNFSLEQIKSDLRLLVNSFQFSADNVVLRPEEWTLVSLFSLKLLSIKNSKVRTLLEDANSVKYIKLILLSHHVEIQVLEQVVRDLTGDIMNLIAKYNIQY